MRLFLVLMGFALPALAQDERFDKLDVDGDGRVSLAEAAGNADLIKGFDRADRNRDGKLTKKEYDALLARAAAAAKAPSAAQSSGAGSTSPKRKKN